MKKSLKLTLIYVTVLMTISNFTLIAKAEIGFDIVNGGFMRDSQNPDVPRRTDTLFYSVWTTQPRTDVEITGFQITYSCPDEILHCSGAQRHGGHHDLEKRKITRTFSPAMKIRKGTISSIAELVTVATAAGTGTIRITGTVTTTKGTFNIDSQLPVTIAPALTDAVLPKPTEVVSVPASAFAALAQPSVRLVYFLPRDRPARPDRIEAFRQLIKDTQSFFADEMERHGYGRKTFRVETDRSGEPIVHRFNGRFNERHYYQRLTDKKVWEEFFPQVNDLQHVYLIAVDLSYESFNEGESGGLGGVIFRPSGGDRPSFSFGSAAVRHRDETSGEKVLGGSAMMPASGDNFYDTRGFLHPLRLITHELAHAFGLDHDFSDPDSAVGGRGFRFSQCDAEWLSVSRYFNSNPASGNTPGNIQLMSTPTYSPEGVTLRFKVTDADGLHQSQLLMPEDGSWGPWKLIGCQTLEGQTQRVEFLSAELTSAPERVMFQFMDDIGNITWATFLVDIASLPSPPSKPVPTPEPLPPLPELVPKSAPATGTWLAVSKPAGLAVVDFTIGPGEFVILAHRDQQVTTKQATVKTYASYFAFNVKANDFPNLAKFFKNGGRIELVSHATLNPLPANTRKPKFGDLVISEIMWGLNGSAQGKQYIELYNTSAHTYTFTDGDLSFRFSTAAEAPLPDEVFPLPSNPNAEVKVIDRVSNKGWKVPGQGGNTAKNKPLISMYRMIDYTTGDTPDGTLASSWQASTGRVNLPAPSYGTPGANHLPPAPIVHVDAAQRPPIYWVGANNGTLHRLVGDEVENLVPNVKNATSLAVDIASGQLYWTEKTSERTGRIKRANLDGTNVRLVKKLTSVPYGIALDTVNRKLYLTNAYGKVQRLNVDGSNFQPNLITDLDTPRNLVLDVTGGKVYWTETTEASGRVRRANLNGSGVQNVATGLVPPLSLAVANSKIYWTEGTTENAGKLHRANLDGTNSELLETIPIAPNGIAVDTGRNSLYLTARSGEIHRRDLDGSGDEPIVTGLVAPSNIVLGITATTPGPTDAPEPATTPAVDAATDVNKDQKVNKTDLLLVVTALGEKPPANPNVDVNADGAVNIADVLRVIEALDDPVAAAAPSLGEIGTSLDPALLTAQIDILRAESDGSMKYEHAIAFFQGLLASIRPTETRLLANYPNPFNPETWIPYHLANPSNVRITIYNIRGSIVRRLDLGHQREGYYTSQNRAAYWDGRNALGESVASGVYFYTLTAGEFTATRKMLIRK